MTIVKSYLASSLHDREKMFLTMIQGVRDYGIVMLAREGEVLSWNIGAERMTGCSASEAIGQPLSRFFLQDDIERGKPEEILRLAASGGPIEVQGMRRRKDGSNFLLRATYTALHDSRGTLCGFSLISHDLSGSTASEAKYRGLLEAAPDAMVVVNQAGEIVLLNVQAEKQFGYRRDELLGQPVKNLIPEGFAERLVADDLRSAEDALDQTIGTGIELMALRKDGSAFPIEIMLSPLDSAEGVLITAAIRDISMRRAAEVLLLQKINELNRSNHELEQFASIASHDLQEPLRMVASYTQLLSRRYKGKLDSDADEFIAFAVDGANRMKGLIRDLLAYSRINTQSGGLTNTSSESALLRALVNLRGAISDSGALVTHDPLPAVMADETQLVQLFQNLVSNAIKYRKPGVAEIHVSAAAADAKRWTFAVQDNGMGIDPRYFERIFGMFQRLHKREDIEGTGIGLAICKKIVERHGGVISVKSEPGRGSTFSFAMARSDARV